MNQHLILASICLLFISKHTIIEATIYCPDPLNIQTNRADATPTPASTSSAGIVTCGSGLTNPGCGVISATGAGICTTLTAPSATVIVTVLNAAAVTSAPADFSAWTTATGGIKTCWNPSAGAVLAVSPALSATNGILACYTTKAGVGSAIYQTIGAGTTASTATAITGYGSYCFTTNCNVGLWYNKSVTINYSMAIILMGIFLALLAF